MTIEERLAKLEKRFYELEAILGLTPQPPPPATPASQQAKIDEEMRQAFEKLDAWGNGTHPWQLARQNAIEDAQAAAQAPPLVSHPGQAHERAALEQKLERIERMNRQLP